MRPYTLMYLLSVLGVRFTSLARSAHTLLLQGDDFDRTGGVMSGTLRKLEGLVRTGGAGSPFCKLVLGVVVVFLILWFVSRQL